MKIFSKILEKLKEPRLSSGDRIFFAKRLSFLLRAGIPLHVSLATIVRQSKKSLRPIFEALAESSERGQGLASGMQSFPQSFPEYIVRMIGAGEESGTLAEHITLVSAELYRRKTVARKLAGSLLYPIIVALGTIALSLFLVLVIFPKVKKLFQGLRVPLPVTTRILMWFSELINSYGLLVLGIIFVFFVATAIVFRKYPQMRKKKDHFVLLLPIVGRMVGHYNLAAALRTASIMLKSGMPIDKSLRYAGGSVSNENYKNAFETVSRSVVAGGTIHDAFKNFPELFPEITSSMVEIGESSGTLSDTLSYLSEMIDEENEDISKMLLGIAEPTLMIVMGLVVGFISLSIITPIYEITQNISH